MKIGFFDSGLGGLILLEATAATLPQYDYLYYGDTAHVPYGDKTETEIYELSKMAMQYLFEAGCLIVIIACNTASAETLRRLQDDYLPAHYPNRRILGVIIPTIETVETTGAANALLLATTRTISSRKYERELQLKGVTGVSLKGVAMPQLVPLIEAGNLSDAASVAAEVITAESGVGDAVILGCTHYTLLKRQLRTQFPSRIFIAQDELIPAKLTDYLKRHSELERQLSRGRSRHVYLTAERPDYDVIISRLLQ